MGKVRVVGSISVLLLLYLPHPLILCILIISHSSPSAPVLYDINLGKMDL